MTINELKQIQLYRQHITNKTDKISVLCHLNGLQCQFMMNAYNALRMRCNEQITVENFGEGLVKNWTVRGTVHIFAEQDLPLFKYKDNESDYLSKQWKGYADRITKEWMLLPERQSFFADFIIEKVRDGVCAREDLKIACRENGMTKIELDCMFDSWGGGMRELCERGFLNYKVQIKKEFEICRPFLPEKTDEALIEQAKRYFTHFAPATIKDTAYYFGWTQIQAKKIMVHLPLENIEIDGKKYFYLNELKSNYPDIPHCILLAGFDQLMLGYQKKESIYLATEHLRGIFNLAGIVMPSIMIDGNIVGRWRKNKNKVIFEMFEIVKAIDKKKIVNTMEEMFDDIRRVNWVEI